MKTPLPNFPHHRGVPKHHFWPHWCWFSATRMRAPSLSTPNPALVWIPLDLMIQLGIATRPWPRILATQLQDSACQLAWLSLACACARLEHTKQIPKSLWSRPLDNSNQNNSTNWILQESLHLKRLKIQRQNRYEIKHGKSLIQNIIVFQLYIYRLSNCIMI